MQGGLISQQDETLITVGFLPLTAVIDCTDLGEWLVTAMVIRKVATAAARRLLLRIRYGKSLKGVDSLHIIDYITSAVVAGIDTLASRLCLVIMTINEWLCSILTLIGRYVLPLL